MPQRQQISSGSPWEPTYGFSRALRVGNMVFVAGTIGTDPDGNPVGDFEAQARCVFEKIRVALEASGVTLRDVVRTRMYLVDKAHADLAGRIHAEYFGDVRPAATMVQVAGLVGEGFLFEAEADAVVG